MAKDKKPDEIQAALENAVEKCDMDGVLYRLREIAVKKRDEAENDDFDAEEKYWQTVITILIDAEERVSNIE